MMEYIFKNGAKITGTAEHILGYAKLVGEHIDPKLLGEIPKGYYLSETKGLLPIKEMQTIHIVHALNKRTVEYFQALKPNPKDFDLKNYLITYINLTQRPEIEELFMELSKRIDG